MLTDNGAVFTANSAARAGSRWRSSSDCAGSGCTTPGRTIRRPAARWSGSTRPRRNGCGPSPGPPTLVGLQHQLNRFQTYYNTVRPHRALGRRTPAQAMRPDPKPFRPARSSPPLPGPARQDRPLGRSHFAPQQPAAPHRPRRPARRNPDQPAHRDLHIRVIDRHTVT